MNDLIKKRVYPIQEGTRVCPMCGVNFTFKSSKKKYCSRQCLMLYHNPIYKAVNKETIKKQKKQWDMAHAAECIEYRIVNKEKLAQNAKDYYKSKPEAIKEYRSNWRKNNKDKTRAWNKLVREENRNYSISVRVSSRIRGALKSKGVSKNNHTQELIGCSISELKAHIESKFKPGMSWDNHTVKGWHIDHIIPCAAFDLTDIEQQKKCFNYTNLQPLWWYENLSKGRKIIGRDE